MDPVVAGLLSLAMIALVVVIASQGSTVTRQSHVITMLTHLNLGKAVAMDNSNDPFGRRIIAKGVAEAIADFHRPPSKVVPQSETEEPEIAVPPSKPRATVMRTSVLEE